MNKTNFKKIFPFALAIALGIGGIFGTISYIKAAVTVGGVNITDPTSASPDYVKPGDTETVTFNVTTDASGDGKIRVEIYSGATTIGDTGSYDYTFASGTNNGLQANVLIGAGSDDGSYNVKVSAQQPGGTGDWISDTETSALVVDGTKPTLQSAVRNSDTQITVTLDEFTATSTIIQADDRGFVVTETGPATTTYAVSNVARGTGNAVVLTVANMLVSGKEGVTVTYATTTNGVVTDVAGNLMDTDETGVGITAWDTEAPTITNITSDLANGSYKAEQVIDIDVTFSEDVNSTGNITVTLDTGGTCTFTAAATSTATCNYTVGAGENSTDLEVSSVTGTIADIAGNAMTDFTPASNLAANKALVIDTTKPTLQSAVRNSDTQITVTLDEFTATSTIIQADDRGFVVTETGPATTTYAVSNVARGTGNAVVLTVANMLVSGKEGVTVTYATTTNGVVTDVAGNLMDTDETGVGITAWDTEAPTITNITSDLANGSYKAEQVIDIDVTFSEDVNSTGNITVTLDTGGTCTFTAAATSTATCNYTVGAGENSTDLEVSSVTGTIADIAGNAMTDFTPASNLAANKALVIDTTKPTLQSAVRNSDTQITVTLDELTATSTIIQADDRGFVVTETGPATTTYAVSNVDRGTGNAVVLTVANMLVSGKEGVTVTYATTTNGVVTDVAGNLMDTDETGVGITAWDTEAPTITNITSDLANGSYKAEQVIDIDVTFSEDVNSTGNITVTLDTGGTCTFTAAATSTATCNYTVGAGENSTDLEVSSVTGTIADIAGNAMTDFTPASNLAANKALVIDTTKPTLQSAVRNSDTQITVTLDEFTATSTIIQADDRGFVVTETGPATTTYAVSNVDRGTGNAVVLTVANMLVSGKEGVTVTYATTTNGVVTDVAGNLMDTDETGVGITAWDTEAPTITNITSDLANGSYKAEQVIDIDVTFSEDVNSTGNITVTLDTGGTCTFTAAATSTATCNYTVGAGENSTDLEVSSVTGTIADIAGNAMTDFTPASNLAANKALVIDTTKPTLQSAVRNSDTQITVTLDEFTATSTIIQADDRGFVVTETGPATTTYAVSNVDRGTGNAVVLTVANMLVSGKEGVTVTYATTTNGVVTDVAGNLMDTDETGVGITAWDTEAPTITNITSDLANGSYKAEQVIDIDVTFSEDVNSTGNITVTLDTGGTCTFTAAATSTATCNYTVGAGENSTDLEVSSVTGTIADIAGNAMTDFTPASNLAANKALVIDTTKPTLQSAVRNSDTQITVTLDEFTATSTIIQADDRGFVVTETGPATTTYAVSNVDRGTGNAVVLTVANMLVSGKEGVTVTYATTTNGVVTDVAGNLMDTDETGVGITAWDTEAPTITNITSDLANGSYKAEQVIDIDVTFSEDVNSTGNITVTLDTGGTCTFTAAATSTATCNYTVGAGENSTDLEVSSVTGTIADIAGNAMTDFTPASNLAANKALVIDTTKPTLQSAVRNSDTQITVTLDEFTATSTIIQADDRGFVVTETGPATTTYAVSNVDRGTGNAVVLTVANMLVSGKEGVTVTYATTTNGVVTDVAGNLMDTDETGVGITAWDTEAPTLSTTTYTQGNTVVTVIRPSAYGLTVKVTAIFNEAMTTAPNVWIQAPGTDADVATTTMSSTSATEWYYNWTVPNTLSVQGEATITFTGTDIAGNSFDSTDIQSVVIDETGPVIANQGITLDKPQYRLTQDPTVTVTVIEDNTASTVTVNGASATESPDGTWTGSFTHGQSSVATYSFDVVATDANANITTKTVQYYVVADDDPDAPTIAITAPAASEEITSASYSITFTTNSATTTAATRVRIDGGSWVEATTNANPGTYTLDVSVLTNGSHTVQVKDTVDAVIGYSNIVTFITTYQSDSTPPGISGAVPANTALNVAIDAVMTITFDEPLANVDNSTVKLYIDADDNNAVSAGDTEVPSIVSLTNSGSSATITITSLSYLSNSGNYIYRISTGVTDVAGNPLAGNADYNFTTVAPTPPTIESRYPVNGATGIAIGVQPYIKFSHAMDVSTVNSVNINLCSDAECNTKIDTFVSPDEGDTTAIIKPNSSLSYGTDYWIRVTTNVLDLAGNAYTPATTTVFTTAAEGVGTLSIDNVSITKSVAHANGEWSGGWTFDIEATIPNNIARGIKMIFDDWKQSGATAIAVANNIRFSVGGGDDVTITAAANAAWDNWLPVGWLNISGVSDNDDSKDGKQITIQVETKIPDTVTLGGSYSAAFALNAE